MTTSELILLALLCVPPVRAHWFRLRAWWRRRRETARRAEVCGGRVVLKIFVKGNDVKTMRAKLDATQRAIRAIRGGHRAATVVTCEHCKCKYRVGTADAMFIRHDGRCIGCGSLRSTASTPPGFRHGSEVVNRVQTLGPGTVVLKVPGPLSRDDLDALKLQAETALPGRRVIVLERGIEIETLADLADVEVRTVVECPAHDHEAEHQHDACTAQHAARTRGLGR